MEKFRVKYFGEGFVGGIPRIRQVDVRHPNGGPMTLYSYPVFKGQAADGSYFLSEDIVDLNRAIFADKNRFLVEPIEEAAPSDLCGQIEGEATNLDICADCKGFGKSVCPRNIKPAPKTDAADLKCPDCEFVGKNERSLRMHRQVRHNG